VRFYNKDNPIHLSMARYKPVCFLLLFLLVFSSRLFAAGSLTIVVEGVEGGLRDNITAALSVPEEFIAGGRLDERMQKRLALQAGKKVRTALEPFGYYNAKVEIRVAEDPQGNLLLKVSVDPGEPVRVTQVRVLLHGPGSAEELLKRVAESFPLTKGDILLQKRYEDFKEKMLSQAQELGYLDASFIVHRISVAEDALTAQIDLEMDTGKRYFFGGTTIEGAPGYEEGFLRRYLTFKEGDTFSYEKIGETQMNFINSERFRKVDVVPQKDETTRAGIPIRVFLEEGPRRRLRQGIGYGTDTGARASLSYRDLNMLGLGHELHSNLYLAERLQGLATSYILPDHEDVRGSKALRVNIQREDVSTYESNFIAVQFEKTSCVKKEVFVTAYAKMQYEEYTVGTQESDARLVMPGIRVWGNSYRDAPRPHSGFHYALEVRGTDEILGSNLQLFQVVSEGGFVLPLPAKISLRARAKAAASLLGDPLGELPPSLRFFAGGDQSVRGYSYQSLGPTDANGEVVGGKHVVFGSVEVERALSDAWGVSLFYDAGNAFDSFKDFRVYEGVGVGLHYYTRVGGLHFSVARQIGIDDPGFRLHFTVGFGM